MRLILSVLGISILLSCNSCITGKRLTVDFSEATVPAPPDYSKSIYWAALPELKDSADHIPAHAPVALVDGQKNATVDVFFIHPTTYYGKENWNADFQDKKVEGSTNTSLINQAAVFNGSCKVYAPQYRQATYRAYFHDEEADYDKAFDLAYEDVKNAFEYYLKNYNHGRPIIIAGHSQGTTHAIRLLHEYFDGKALENKLVAAYLIGMPVYKGEFKSIAACKDSTETGCYVSWRSYLRGSEKDEKDANAVNIIVTNPISWKIGDSTFYNSELNMGGIGRNPDKVYPHICSVQTHHELLWVSKPDIPGKAFIFMKNYHIADYNLFWLNIRRNVGLRVWGVE